MSAYFKRKSLEFKTGVKPQPELYDEETSLMMSEMLAEFLDMAETLQEIQGYFQKNAHLFGRLMEEHKNPLRQRWRKAQQDRRK